MHIEPQFKQIVRDAYLTQMKSDQIRELAPKLPQDPGELDGLLDYLIERRFGSAFTSVVLAALDAGRTFDARHLAVGVTMLPAEHMIPSVAMRCSGDVAAALLKAVEDQRLDPMFIGVCVLAAARWRHENRPDSTFDDIATEFRVLRRRRHPQGDKTPMVLAAIAEFLADIVEPHLWPEIRGKMKKKEHDDARGFLGEMDDMLAQPILAPLGKSEGWRLFGYTVQSPMPKRKDGKKLGRNDPCHCGSGKKYKRCCMEKDKKRWHEASDVAGVTWSEMQLDPEKYVTPERLEKMSASEVIPLDPTLVDPSLHGALLDKLLEAREFEAIVRFVKKLGWSSELSPHVTEAMTVAADMGKVGLVRQMMEGCGDQALLDELPFAVRLLLADDRAAMLDVIEQEAGRELDEPSIELACSVLASDYPALGMHLARSVLACKGASEDSLVLLEDLLEARARLELTGDDPVELVMEKVSKYRKKTVSDKLEEKERELQERSRERGALMADKRKIKEELADLDRARRLAEQQKEAAVSEAEKLKQTTKEDPRVADLTRRLKAVEDEDKLKHAERNQLRRELRKTRQELEEEKARKAEQAATAPEDEVDPDAGYVPVEKAQTQKVRIPTFPERFTSQHKKIPAAIVEEAVQLACGLASADKAAWKGVLRLEHDRNLQRRRFAGDYRLIFKTDDDAGVLEVVEVVDRKELDRRVRRLT